MLLKLRDGIRPGARRAVRAARARRALVPGRLRGGFQTESSDARAAVERLVEPRAQLETVSYFRHMMNTCTLNYLLVHTYSRSGGT